MKNRDKETRRNTARKSAKSVNLASLKTALRLVWQAAPGLTIAGIVLTLARAFLRDSQLSVLDEPTSAMDAKAEYDLFRGFRQLAAGRAAVLISRRFSTVRMADCIYVLEGGKIIEHGAHDDLMAQNGAYARLFEMQAQHYR